jgi:hypothetical protein
MAKVRVMPTSASAAMTSGWTSKSLNSGASSATGAPPSSSTACSSCSGAGAPVSACSISGVVGVFSVEVSALASGLLGDRLRGALAPLRSCPGRVSRDQFQRRRGQQGPGRTSVSAQEETPRGVVSSGRQRTDTQRTEGLADSQSNARGG